MYTAKKKNQRINYFYKNNQINRCKPQKKNNSQKKKNNPKLRGTYSDAIKRTKKKNNKTQISRSTPQKNSNTNPRPQPIVRVTTQSMLKYAVMRM